MAIITANQETMENIFGDDKKQSLIQLRKLVKENSELNKYRIDDGYLNKFLYWTSFDVTEAFEKMQVYQENLVKYSSWCASKPPLELKEIIEYNPICLLDERDNEGRVVFLIKLGNLDTSKTLEDNSSALELMIEYAYLQEETAKHGICIIIDMENTPWKYVTWLTPTNIKIGIKLVTTYPCIDYKIHLVKSSMLFDAALKILWPILPSIIKENVLFHFKDWPSLHKHVKPEYLPKEYGGSGPDIDYNYYHQKLYDKNDELKEKLQYRKAIIKY